MKAKNYPVTLLLMLFLGIQTVYNQTISDAGNDLPVFAAKYNQSLLGKNVFVFDPEMDMHEIQLLLDTIFNRQAGRGSEFSTDRYALLFKPGTYELDIKVGYYMQVIGLGKSPEDVVIAGAVRSNTRGSSVLTNFWRGAENLTVIPAVDSTNIWGVSQAAPLRRIHIRGNLNLFDKGYASGGFMADSKIDGTIASGPQQQWLSRNSQWKEWVGGVWNMMFVGIQGTPAGNWPERPYTTIPETPLIREKPYLVYENNVFIVKIPELKENSAGPGWVNGDVDDNALPFEDFYLVQPGADHSESINEALSKGKNLLFTPGIYQLDESIKVNRPGTIIMGIGMPSLVPMNGNSVMEISDIDGVTICGILIDAGSTLSETLLEVGEPGSAKSHKTDPTFLFDVFVRVGGPGEGSVTSCVTVNSNNVCIDHIWLWRADHGNGVGWDVNRGANGLIVNGDDVTVYGLFNEHFQEYQTIWNGNGGRVYFYQSEMPYDPPSVEAWKHNGIYGYASYKVADHVTTHEAWGVGIYNVFYQAPIIVDQAIEAPAALESSFHHIVTYWLNGNEDSVVKSVINGKGDAINTKNRKATVD